MSHIPATDWDPRSAEVLANQIAAYDELRRQRAVAHSPDGHWAVLRHAEVVRVLDDHETFSNVVSRRPSVPNGMDPPEHTAYRAIVDHYFSSERMAAFEPVCRAIAAELWSAVPRGRDVDVMEQFAEPFANHVQCAFMGWPASLREPLREWTRRNQAATRAQDREAMATVATEFDGYIREQLDERRAAGSDAPDDPTTDLLRETVHGRPLTDDEIVSIVRNWTVGELGTIAASVGIIVHHLATEPATVEQLRADPSVLERASDEILRIHAPLVANRRRTTRDVRLGGRDLPSGAIVLVVWASANRDESVMGDPDAFRLDRVPDDNLLYGRGLHRCPGAPLARLELRVVLEEILGATSSIELGAGEPSRGGYPASGFTHLPVSVT